MRRRLAGCAGTAGLLLALAAAVALGGCGSGDPTAYVTCVDSTHSTVGVRHAYKPELMTIAEEAAEDQGDLYVDACGSNATGTVRWRLTKELRTEQDLSGVLLENWAASQAKKLKGEFSDLLATTSPDPGTPLGKILGVIARKCAADPGPCKAYILTDASWWDNGLKVYDGVPAQEERDYLKTFGPLVRGLDGASVYFVGVGLGTDLGEQRLHEARKVAEALVKAGGGTVAYWDVSLGEEEEEHHGQAG